MFVLISWPLSRLNALSVRWRLLPVLQRGPSGREGRELLASAFLSQPFCLHNGHIYVDSTFLFHEMYHLPTFLA